MGAAYFIVLDNPDPGFDTFVNGKAITRDAERLSKLAKSLGLRPPEGYFVMTAEDAAEFDIDMDAPDPPEQWFEAEEGLTWAGALRRAIESNPTAVKKAKDVISDLAEFENVFSQAKAIGAKWHFSIDF